MRLTEKTAYALREDEKMAGCVTIKIRYSDFETTTRQETVDYSALDDVLIAKAKDLFKKTWQNGRLVRLIGVRFSQLIPISTQISLFENNVEKLNLYKAVDEIKDRYGKGVVKKAVNTSLDINDKQSETRL